MQTRLHSLAESLVNVFIGYWISIGAQVLIFPIFDISTSFGSNLKIGLLFTVVSILRSYGLRRVFTKFRRVL